MSQFYQPDLTEHIDSEWTIRGLPFIIVHELDTDNDEMIILSVFHAALDR